MPKPLSPLAHRIALIAAIIFLIFSAGLFYVNKVLLPVQIRGLAMKSASEALKRQVTFDSLQFSPLRGFVITDLVVADKNDPQAVFIKARSASAQILFLALLQKKVILPSLHIDSPEITLTRDGQGQWNFSDLMAAPAASPADARSPASASKPASPGMDVVVGGFQINTGKVMVSDDSDGAPFRETVHIPLLKGALALSGALKINGSLLLDSTSGTLKFNARMGLKDHVWNVTAKAKDIEPSRYLRFLPTTLPLKLTLLRIADAEVSASGDGTTINVSGNANLPGLDIALPDKTALKGDLTFNNILAAFGPKDLSFQGTVSGDKLAVTTAAGVDARLSMLKATGIQLSQKSGRLAASAGLEFNGLDLTLGEDRTLSGNMTLNNVAVNGTEGRLAIKADAAADNLAVTLGQGQKITGDMDLKQMTALIAGPVILAGADVAVRNAAIGLPAAKVSVNADITAPDTRLRLYRGRLDSALHASFKKLDAQAGDININGTPDLRARLSLDPSRKEPLNYDGSLSLASLKVSGVPNIGEIRDIQGGIAFTTGSAATQNLTFTALGVPMTTSGGIKDFAAPVIDVSAKASHVDISLLAKVIPDLIKDQQLALKGFADVDANFNGPLARPQSGKARATVVLKDAAVASGKLNLDVGAINGQLTYSPEALTLRDLSLTYQGRAWTLNGTCQGLPDAPAVNAAATSDGISAEVRAQKSGDAVKIVSLKGTWLESDFNVSGKVMVPAGNKPSVDLDGVIKLSLRDLPKMLPPGQAQQVDALKLGGIIKITSHMEGIPQDWQDLVSTTSIETPALYMSGYQIADLAIRAEQKDGRIDPLTLKGTLYGGELNVTSSVDLKAPKFPFTTALKLDNTSLELLKKDTPLRNQQLAGSVSGTADLKGELGDIRAMTGDAALKITKGYLWQLEILSKVLSILSSSFKGGDIIVTDASATFKIADAKVMTKDLTLSSATVAIAGEGWVDLDQNLDLNFTPRLLSGDISKVTGNTLAMFNPTDGIINIRVYGTLSKPKYEHNISAPQVIKKTLQNTVGTFFKLFE